MINPLIEIQSYGQSIWYDNLRRAMLASGELQRLIENGVTGVTSNPTIFEKAIAGSKDYDEELNGLANGGYDPYAIYERLVLEDIRNAADLLRLVYERTNGMDGYVSLEVNPALAHDTSGSIAEARRLFTDLARPNVMIKIPATAEGISATETLIAEGINVNITLIFSLAQYEAVAQAYLAGLERRAVAGGELNRVASVASFFISRVDTAVDRALEKIGAKEIQGQIAIANAKAAYQRFKEVFNGDRWEKLAASGARVQRPLWASTGAKNPHYPDTIYVDSLIGPNTVNTVPPPTLLAFQDHGRVAPTLEAGLDQAYAQLSRLARLGINLNDVGRQLQEEGLSAFVKSFDTLIASIAEKREKLQIGWQPFIANLGAYQTVVDEALNEMEQDRVMGRIWAHDHTIWKPEPTEITNRLGWLDIVEKMVEALPGLSEFVDSVRAEGFTHALLLGMGGSSLAPEVFRKTFGVRDGYLDLRVLDSTDPEAVLSVAKGLDLSRTLFIVSTKSGSTVETFSFFKFFYNRVVESLGFEHAGEHFIAITDPGSKLADTAARYDFRATFFNDPNIGGRYSALSYFGLVPAALAGVDVKRLLDRALEMSCNNESCNSPVNGNNLGARLGAILAELAKAGRDKLTLVASPSITSFGDWLEQLVAESTGKEGKGIFPVVGEPVETPDIYGRDRLFVYLQHAGDGAYDWAIQDLEHAGQPVVRLCLEDRYDLGGQFFLWEMAVAVAGYRLGINPFDQPNVESAKVLARQMVAAYQDTGRLPEPAPSLHGKGITVYGDVSARTPVEALHAFLAQAHPGDYIVLQAYLQPTTETDAALLKLRARLRDVYGLATAVGYGPRFLHSTGQLHKGDAGRGLFIQFTANAQNDFAIPDEAGSSQSSISFGTLKLAQALGDYQALSNAKRRVIRFHLEDDVLVGLEQIITSLL